MSITLDQLDKIVHTLNEQISGSHPAYMVSLESTGYTYCISLNGFALYDPDVHTISEDIEEAYGIELICRSNLLDYCSFWEEARVRFYAPREDPSDNGIGPDVLAQGIEAKIPQHEVRGIAADSPTP